MRGRPMRRYEAVLYDGPRHGTHLSLESRPDGDPIEVLPVRGNLRGAYVLAGLSGLRGRLPYRWVTTEEWAGLRRWLRGRKRSD